MPSWKGNLPSWCETCIVNLFSQFLSLFQGETWEFAELMRNSSVNVADPAPGQFVPWWETRKANGVAHKQRLHLSAKKYERDAISPQTTADLSLVSSKKKNRRSCRKAGKWGPDKSLCKSQKLVGIHLPQLWGPGFVRQISGRKSETNAGAAKQQRKDNKLVFGF